MDFEKEEYTPMIDTKKPKPKLGAKAGNTQEFSSLNGVNVKDKAAREDMEELAEYIGTLPPEPWQPLEDGYSNFWFELTDDTLSPWLNFSAKTENAVIDWGDGSGEVALDTLTPTHTYAKAGRYVVKVKGVTGISNQQQTGAGGFVPPYAQCLRQIEFNSDIVSLDNYAFWRSFKLENVAGNITLTSVGSNSFDFCPCLKTFESLINTTNFAANFYGAYSLKSITIGSNVTSIATNSFITCYSLTEIHVLPTNPPTLGASVFSGLPSNYIIYVPVGYAETYKAASGWSDFADHILEEGQTPNRAMLAKFNSAKTDEPQDDMR